MALVHGLHTDIRSRHHSESVAERCREVWWTVYVLDCHLSSLMGVPLAIAEHDIRAQLPSFAGYPQKSLALSIHVRLGKAITLIRGSKYMTQLPFMILLIVLIPPSISCVRRRRSFGQPLLDQYQKCIEVPCEHQR